MKIDAYAVAGGYSSDINNDIYRISSNRLRIGGSQDNIFDKPGANYPVTGGDNIVYNETSSTRDSKVSYLRFTLPEDVTETDKYTVTITNDGGVTGRDGNLDIYAGVADMTWAVVYCYRKQ